MDEPISLEAISRILFQADPIGINFESNTDEYDPEAESILSRLDAEQDADEIQKIVYEEFVRWFDKHTAGEPNRYRPIAESIFAFIHRESEGK